MPNEHGVERCPNQHADDGHPYLHCGAWGALSIADAQHVREGLEQGKTVLRARASILYREGGREGGREGEGPRGESSVLCYNSPQLFTCILLRATHELGGKPSMKAMRNWMHAFQ